MAYQPSTEYLKTQVMTASPEMLQLMLWDGAIRFAEQGKDAILRKDIEGSYKMLLKAQKIIMEMSNSLRREINPDLCEKLSALYNFMYRRLVDANVQKDPAFVDDALKVMRHQRETWVMLMEKLAAERTAKAVETAQENAEAIDASQVLATASAPAPVAPRPTVKPNRFGYPAVALQPAGARTASLSVQG